MAEEDVRQLTEKAARKGATELELAGNGLTGPPPQIGRLSQLQILLIHDNQSRPTDNQSRPTRGRQGCPPHFGMAKLEPPISDEPRATGIQDACAGNQSPS